MSCSRCGSFLVVGQLVRRRNAFPGDQGNAVEKDEVLADVDPVDQLGQGGEALQVGTAFLPLRPPTAWTIAARPGRRHRPARPNRPHRGCRPASRPGRPAGRGGGRPTNRPRPRPAFLRRREHGPRKSLGRVVILQQRRQENDREDALFLGKQGIVPLGVREASITIASDFSLAASRVANSANSCFDQGACMAGCSMADVSPRVLPVILPYFLRLRSCPRVRYLPKSAK